MGDGDWTACLDLLLEKRDDGSVASQYVSEADCHELSFCTLQCFCRLFVMYPAVHPVGEQLRDLVCLAFFDLVVKGLNDHLAEALRCAHDVRRVDRLVGTDQDETLGTVYHCRVGCLVGADRIIFDCLTRAVLHQRYVLVSCRVVDDLRAVSLEDLENLSGIADRSDDDIELHVRVFLFQLQLNVISVVLIDIEDDQVRRIMCSDLAAELTSD